MKQKLFILPIILIYSLGIAQQLQPDDLEYLGAFRLTDSAGTPDNVGWEWSNWSSGLTYYPYGDPEGPEDGFPGSLFGVGHDHTQYISEISIPVPVISPEKDVNDLNTAQTLQEFQDIKGNLFNPMELPRVGLEYLPPQGSQETPKLYFAWAPHLDEGAVNPSHGWCELDLANPQSTGTWRIGDYWNYVTGDYIFSIPPAWADVNTPNMYVATGRFRDGGQGSMGPSIIAYGPWIQGNPPESGTTLTATPLLLYGNVYQENPQTLNNYHHSDQWSGGVWLTVQDKSAVIFVGTKGEGDCWYGYADGTQWPNDQNKEGSGERGWWSGSFAGQFLFYDTGELAAVAQGNMEVWEPQPYATLDIDECLYHIDSEQQWYHIGAAACDRQRGLLYVMEPLADSYKSIIHVWRVTPSSAVQEKKSPDHQYRLEQNYPNPFNLKTTIVFSLPERTEVTLEIFDMSGRCINTLISEVKVSGMHRVFWNGNDLRGRTVASGMYLYRLLIKNPASGKITFTNIRKMIITK